MDFTERPLPRPSPWDLAPIALALALGCVQLDSADTGIPTRFGQVLLEENRLPTHEDVGLTPGSGRPLPQAMPTADPVQPLEHGVAGHDA